MSRSDDKNEARPRTNFRVRLRQKAQLTLPEEVRHVLRIGEGDEVEFTVEANGRVTVRGYVVGSDRPGVVLHSGTARW